MELYDDKAARSRSIMHKQKRLCNGAATGWQCSHYWELVLPMDVPNSDHLHRGETHRYCTLVQIGNSPMDLGDSGSEMPVVCNRYCNSTRAFDPNVEEYKPLTPEEIAEINGSINDSPPVELFKAELGVVETPPAPHCGECGLLLFDGENCPDCQPNEVTAGEDNA